MANYTIRADGTAANKAAAEDGDPAVIADCMNITVAISQSYSPDDQILFADTGGEYRGPQCNFSSSGSGTSGHDIIIKNYPGHTPVLKGSYDLTDATQYKWTESVAQSGEWHVEAAAGGDPSLIDPDYDGANGYGVVFIDDVCIHEGTIGALADHEWAYGDNDSLGYNTVYIRDDTGDPDTSGALIEAAQVGGCMYIGGPSYITVDGLIFKHANLLNYIGGFLCQGSSYITVQNCEAHWTQGVGIGIKGDHCTIDNCVASYCGAHNLTAGGFEGNHATYMVIKNSVTHHCRTIGYLGEDPYDGYGLKMLWCDDSEIFGNETYSNDLEGIDLDGSLGGEGCDRCKIYNNLVYDNGAQGILVELFSDDCEVFHNLVYDNQTGSYWGGVGDVGVTICKNTKIYGNIIYRTKAPGSGWGQLIYIIDYSPGLTGPIGHKIYGNTLDGGGYSTYIIAVDGYTVPMGMKIKNNMMTNSTDACLNVNGSDYTGLDVDYNLYRRDDSSSSVVLKAWTGYTVITGGTGTWYTSQGFGENSIEAAPVYTDAGNQDFTLSSGSPAIGAGVNLGSPYNTAPMPGASWPDSVTTGDRDDY